MWPRIRDWFQIRYERMWLRLAVYVLIGRNVQRCRVISRKDNNELWYMGESVEAVSKRIAERYENE